MIFIQRPVCPEADIQVPAPDPGGNHCVGKTRGEVVARDRIELPTRGLSVAD